MLPKDIAIRAVNLQRRRWPVSLISNEPLRTSATKPRHEPSLPRHARCAIGLLPFNR